MLFRIFLSSPDSWESLEKDLLDYRMNHSTFKTNNLSLNDILPASLSIMQQFKLLSSIPNFHKWSWYGENTEFLRFEQRFSTSCSRYPGSPRNRIIQAVKYRADAHLLVFSIIKNMYKHACKVPYQIIKKHYLKSSVPLNKKRRTSHLPATLNDQDSDTEPIDNIEDQTNSDAGTPNGAPVIRSNYKETLYR